MARIMVVDDAAFMRLTLKMLLEEAGHEVVAQAANGKEAVDLYSHFVPDVITMDITMPGMDGITSLKEILKVDRRARIIMCSAMGQQGMVLEAIESGAIDFIVKPFHKDRVLAAINKQFKEVNQ